MREIRQSGLEGGETNMLGLPYPIVARLPRTTKSPVVDLSRIKTSIATIHNLPPGCIMRRTALSFLILLNLLGMPQWARPDELPKPPFYTDKSNLLQYLDAQGKPTPIKTVSDWEKRRDHILANMQLVMGSMPPDSRKVPIDLKVEATETLAKVIRKKITFAVEKDDRLTAYLLIPRDLKGKAPAMLCLHQTVNIGKAEPAGLGKRDNLKYGLELAERGYVTLAPDYPNYGDYKIDVYAKGYVSATMKGIWNHMLRGRSAAIVARSRWCKDRLHRSFAGRAQLAVRCCV